MFKARIDAGQAKALIDATTKAGRSFGKELSAAINDVSRKTKVKVGKDIRAVVAIKTAEAKKPISIQGKASAQNLQVMVRLKKTDRLGLRHFGARQTKKGVSYKISKKGGRTFVAGAFQGPTPKAIKMSWRGNVFKRVGKSRLPIVQIKGVSAFGAYVKNNLEKPGRAEVAAELFKQVERRIKLNVLRANGLVST